MSKWHSFGISAVMREKFLYVAKKMNELKWINRHMKFKFGGLLLVVSVFITLCIQFVITDEEYWAKKEYSRCPKVFDNKINLHFIPHSHDDVGWLTTVNQTFYGEYFPEEGVKHIITSVVESLKSHPERRYVQVETAFLWKWWQEQNEKTKSLVKRFVRQGRLEILNGGWTMNDEATTNYQSIIDQFTLGFKRLDEMFGYSVKPTIGWQIDTFGHSKEMASIYAQMGFDAVVLGRMDYRDKETRIASKHMEFIWQGNDVLGPSSRIFTTTLYNSYVFPEHFCLTSNCRLPGPSFDEYRFWDEMMGIVEAEMRIESRPFKTNHILIPMGDDLAYTNAQEEFRAMDFLIRKFRERRGRFNLVYSTLSCYINAVNDAAKKAKVTFDLEKNDFFPYANQPGKYWTGFYTTRSNLKRFERVANNLLQVVKQLCALEMMYKHKDFSKDMVELIEAVAVLQHHDGITGTHLQHVAYDYALLLHKGMVESQKHIDQIISDLMKKPRKSIEDVRVKMVSCLWANISYCNASNRNNFTVAVHNPQSTPMDIYVRLPVNSTNFTIKSLDGKTIDYDIVKSYGNFSHSKFPLSKFELIFLVENLPPLGLRYFIISKNNSVPFKYETKSVDDKFYFGDETTGFRVDERGFLESVTINGLSTAITQKFHYYENNTYAGLYVFSSKNLTEVFYTQNNSIIYDEYRGKLCDEVRQTFNEYTFQIIRVCKRKSFIEFDWMIGPLPHTGLEVTSRFETDMKTFGVFYTDSNGRQMIKRIRNFRPTYDYTHEDDFAGNFYPVTSRIELRDEDKILSIMTDRCQAGTSPRDGQVELLVQRFTFSADKLGASEILYEVDWSKGIITRGQHLLSIVSKTKNENPNLFHRKMAQTRFLSPWVFLGVTTNIKQKLDRFRLKFNAQFSPLNVTLDERIHVLSLEPWNDHQILLRLENIAEENKKENFIRIDLQYLFQSLRVVFIAEMNLAANRKIDSIHKMEWYVKNEDMAENKDRIDEQDGVHKLTQTKVTIRPQQIRTFIVMFSHVL